jgi:hypothetical protein
MQIESGNQHHRAFEPAREQIGQGLVRHQQRVPRGLRNDAGLRHGADHAVSTAIWRSGGDCTVLHRTILRPSARIHPHSGLIGFNR